MKTVLTGEYIKGEVSARHREGHKLWIELSMAPIYKKERIAGFMCILRDITKRKIDERNILESEARYHDLFENSLEGIALLDESSNPIDVNERACQILGYSKGELLSTNLASIIHPEDLKEKDHDAAMKQLLNGESINTIYRIRKKNGSYINIQLSTKMLDKGTFLNVVQDITDRIRIETEIKHKQDELAASEKKYRRLTECAKDMIYRMSIPDGRYDYVSPASIEITGYKPQEFYNSPILIKQILHPDWDDYFKNQWKKLIKGEMPPTYEYQIIHKSGETRWLNQRNVLIRDQENRPIAIEGIVSNITESKKVEEALRESERRLKEAEKLAGLGHWVLDIPTKKLFWSDGVYKIFERDLEDFKGSYRLFLDYVHPEDRSAVDEAYRGTLEQSPYFNIEHRILLGDGREKFVHEHGVTQYDDNKIPIQSSGTIQDISEHKQAEKILKNYHHELQTMVEAQTSELYAANKELEAFAYSVSHDLRAPLRAIHGFTQILLEDYIEKLDEEAMRLGRVIQDNASKMSRLIDDLLNFSRTGRKEMHFTLVDMKKIIRESYYEITDKEERDRIEFSLDNIIDSTGDINMLRQVWINLISNAVKFSSKKNLSQIVISCIEEEKKIIYKIEDNGVGFKMRYNEKLFGVFQRLHNDKEFEGTGVGLALCQRIIKRHGGEIWAESELNKGTAFYFTIPKRNIH